MPSTAECMTESRLRFEQDRVVGLRAAKEMDILPCPLVPDATPQIESYRGMADLVEWFVTVEGESVRDWQVTGPNRSTPAEAVEAWNAAWGKS